MRLSGEGSDWLVQVADWGQVALVDGGPTAANGVIETLFVSTGDLAAVVELAERWRDQSDACLLPLHHVAGITSGPAGGPAVQLHRQAPRGSTLVEVAEVHGPLGEAMVAALFADLLPCVVRCHRDGLVFGGLGPDRLFVCPPGMEGIAALRCHDAGLASMLALAGHGSPAPDGNAFAQVLGPVEVVAPEVADGLEPGPASDIYTVCATMAWLLLGRHVHSGATPLLSRHSARSGPNAALANELMRLAPTLAEPLLRGLSANTWLRSGVATDLMAAGVELLDEAGWLRVAVANKGGPWAIGSPLIPLAAYAGATSFADRYASKAERSRGRRSSSPEVASQVLSEPDPERVRKARLQAALSELDLRRAVADQGVAGKRITVVKLVIILVTMAVCGVMVWVGLRRTVLVTGGRASQMETAPPTPMKLPKPRTTPVTAPID